MAKEELVDNIKIRIKEIYLNGEQLHLTVVLFYSSAESSSYQITENIHRLIKSLRKTLYPGEYFMLIDQNNCEAVTPVNVYYK